jgi:hypothetical protein
MYKRNRRKAIKTVLGEEGRRCDIDKEIVETHFTRTAARKPCDVGIYENIQTPEDRNSVPTSRITPEDVAKMCRGLVVFIGGWRCSHLGLGRMRAFPFALIVVAFFGPGTKVSQAERTTVLSDSNKYSF